MALETQRPPAVLFLLDWYPVAWSTREQYYWQLCTRLVQAGLKPVLVVSQEPSGEVRARFEQTGAELLAGSYHAHPLAYWGLIRRLAGQYTVRFAHVRFFDYFTAVFWMCWWCGIRQVLFTEANSGEWNNRGWKAALIRLRAAVMCYPLVHLIAISRFIRDRLMAVGIAGEKISVVYNGVDLRRFQPDAAARQDIRARMNADESTVVLLYMAVLLAWKRPDVVLRVCAKLVERGVRVQLWMVGRGPLQAELEALARELRIEEQVRWMGHQPDPHRWLASGDVFLHAAVGEAFGNVLVEALGCGLPVVATASGAAGELIAEGRTGRLVAPDAPGDSVEPGDNEVERLATAVQQVTGDRGRYGEVSRAAALAAQQFTTDLCVERTMQVYAPWLAAGEKQEPCV